MDGLSESESDTESGHSRFSFSVQRLPSWMQGKFFETSWVSRIFENDCRKYNIIVKKIRYFGDFSYTSLMKYLCTIFLFIILTSCSVETRSEPQSAMVNSGNLISPILVHSISWSGELSFPECHIIDSGNLTPAIAELAKKVETYADNSQKLDNQKYAQALASGAITSEYYLQVNWSPFF